MPNSEAKYAAFIPRRILLVKLRHHGDMVLTTPVINRLRQHYPDAEIDVLLYKETRPILSEHPLLSHIHVIDRTWKKQGIRYQLQQEYQLLKAVRARHYDLVINLADQWRSALLSLFTGARVRLGFDYKKRRSPVWRAGHTELVTTENHSILHTVEQNMSILSPLGIPVENAQTSMHYSESDKAFCQQLLLKHHVTGGYIVIQPTSRWTFKCWDDDKFASVIDGLADTGLTIVMTAGPDKKERDMVRKIQDLTHNPQVISVAGQLSLTQLAAMIDGAKLFIGVDSAPMHMAAALNTPCVALFGPTKMQHWRPWGNNNTTLWAGDYAPLPAPDSIDTKTQQRYLHAIPVSDVIDAARSYLHD
ncbi:putative lipopolysaccharide heptosyltransferase III [Rahnella variigena]|jgi:heptosyltransferase-3|uniref:putative lipopolysaccharide heptosyltransferase III n=1 Tax=Rahnella variigena TaxID=574964 RepID=UPI0024492691|nr:putative lipopolysaccharide heptosyltransferase III [Rahnella variigena]MDH2896956.1 putative lipopolysaccharide heptosyltransferase III [Rahnella variigena]